MVSAEDLGQRLEHYSVLVSQRRSTALRAGAALVLVSISALLAFVWTEPPTAVKSFVGGSQPSSGDLMWARCLTAVLMLAVFVVVAMLVSSGLPDEVGVGPFTYKRSAGPEAIKKVIELGDQAAGESRQVVKLLEGQLDLTRQLSALEDEVAGLRQLVQQQQARGPMEPNSEGLGHA